MTDYTHRICKDCRHWHALPRQQAPVALGATVARAVDMAIPETGQCREKLVGIPAMMTQQGQIAVVSGYLQTAGEFAACSHFQVQPCENNGQSVHSGVIATH